MNSTVFGTTTVIWKNNKATITHGTHQLMPNCYSCGVERLPPPGFCFFSREAFPLTGKVGAVTTHLMNHTSVITVSCTLLSPQRSYKYRLLMRLVAIMVNTLDLALIADYISQFISAARKNVLCKLCKMIFI